jgi:hypothetical protein
MCNQAIDGGLTREQTWDTLTRLSRTHPDEISAATLTRALEERFARTEFRMEEFGAEDEVDEGLLATCNEAIRRGHTRDEVFDALRVVQERHPEQFPYQAVFDALEES